MNSIVNGPTSLAPIIFDPQLAPPEVDFGTPQSVSTELVTLVIDGVSVTVPKGTSIMRAAKLAGIGIPKLCATDNLEPFGSCRLCLVEIEGRRGMPASCTTPVEPGLKVTTQNAKLAKVRKGVMELYISDHPLDCLTCSANGDCELQDMAGAVGLREVRYGQQGANHFQAKKDESNPYFTFEASKCIVCSRCVRACEEVQGTFALTIDGTGFRSKVSAGIDEGFFNSECVSCGACVQACPTATLNEKSVIELGTPEHAVETTCAYCGVGCTFRADMKGDQVVRMVPAKSGEANDGHSCVKGRFAWGYATHKDRILKPMIRAKTSDPWQEVSWDEAIQFSAKRFLEIQEKYGRKSIGGITSSRTTNEEVWVVQKMIRTAFRNNNTDTCARVCHSPTGFGLKKTLGTSAGTQNFVSVEDTDLVLLIGANPTDAHPVFASRMKKRLRQGAEIIVCDPRRIDLVDSPHIKASIHIPLVPGANVALINALAHTIVSENLADWDYVKERCDLAAFEEWLSFIKEERNSPEAVAHLLGGDAAAVREAARRYAKAPRASIYYGLGVTEHSQGSTMVIGMANLAMLTGNIGRSGVGVNPLRGQNNVQGSCDMGSFPHEFSDYRSVADPQVNQLFSNAWGVAQDPEPGYRIPNMFDAAIRGDYKGMFVQGEDIAQSDPNTQHVEAALENLECLVVCDLFLNETSKFAHVFLPGTSFLEKDGTFTNAERRIGRVRPVMAPKTGKHEWQIPAEIATAMGYPMHYGDAADIMDEIAALTPSFQLVSFERLDSEGSLQWPVNDAAPNGTPIMHIDHFVRGKGLFVVTEFVPTEEKVTPKFPLILTTGRILSQYNVGAQTRRTANNNWHPEDVLEIHPHDAEERGIKDGALITLKSRKGETTLHAKISERMQPGVVYTTFHMPATGANVITTDFSDWATNCPEYKVTAVQVAPATQMSEWQKQYLAYNASRLNVAEPV
ncbi:MAG: formate dehydrogenase subunit alpha [Pseudomonadales bacterium]|jgi:formate dehydrogenase major subunit|nr:formate dehydrogenase subunit alpha [Pseudomonadales bacterium]